MNITPVLNGEGEVEKFIAVESDITERKREEQRRAEELRLSALLAEVGTTITQSNELTDMLQRCSDALVRHLDGAFARIWTLNKEDNVLELQSSAGLYTHLDGQHSRIPFGKFKIGLIAQEQRPHLTNTVIGDPRVGEQEWAKREGMVAFAGYPLLLGGEVLGVMGMFARHALNENTLGAMALVTNSIALGIQRMRGNEELRKSKDSAEQANQAKSQFLANMSHELRTPLNAVIMYSELLMEEAEDLRVQEFLPDLDKIRNAGRHLLGLINNVLDLSKIEAGKMEVFLEEFDLPTMVAEVASTIRPMIEKGSNVLEVNCPQDIGTMHSDITKVRQVLFNLLSNASKFTEKGAIHFDVSKELRDDADWVALRVKDAGIGMTSEQMEKLFQTFTQADASTTRKYGGTGLGLAISKRLCQMLGGDIEVESREGHGSTFTVQLPLNSHGSPRDLHPEQPVMGERTSGDCTVLVIDDDPDTRGLMTRFLRKEGYRAVTASSGEEGLRLARQVLPAMITLDVMMPRTDGWSVLAALKADPQLSEIPVIMLTMVDDRNLGYVLGASEYLIKPIDRALLANMLEKYRPQHTPRRVLVVDDDTDTRRAIAETLNEQGWQVIEAANGREALAVFAQLAPDLVLLDLLMPDMDGFEFAAELHRSEVWRKTPIIVITAKDLSLEDRLRLKGNVQRVLQKDAYNPDELRQLLHTLANSAVQRKLRD